MLRQKFCVANMERKSIFGVLESCYTYYSAVYLLSGLVISSNLYTSMIWCQSISIVNELVSKFLMTNSSRLKIYRD